MTNEEVLESMNGLVDSMRAMAEAVCSAIRDNPETETDESRITVREGYAIFMGAGDLGREAYGIFAEHRKDMNDFVRVLRSGDVHFCMGRMDAKPH